MSDGYWPGFEEDQRSAAENWRRLQAKELLLRFKEQHGRPAESAKEIEDWVASGAAGEQPIKPRPDLRLDDSDCKQINNIPGPPEQLDEGEMTGLGNWLRMRPGLDPKKLTVEELMEITADEGLHLQVWRPEPGDL